MSKKTLISAPLTWDELADDYDKCHSGRPARTQPLDYVFEWAQKQKSIYYVSEEGTLHRKLRKK